MSQSKSNKQFMILSAIGILLVVVCHFAGSINILNDVFPYSSFFMSLFIFISGYFYSTKKEEHVGKSILHKFKKIIVPFFLINLFYGIFCTVMRSYGIVDYGAPISLYTLFVQPFINNNQFVFNFPSWFVPVLFVTYCVYLLIHKFIIKGKKINEIIGLVIFIIFNMLAIYFNDIARQEDLRTLFLKVAFFLPFFEIGYLYKMYLQKYEEKLNTPIYLAILVIFNLVLIGIFGDLNYDMHEFSGFSPYVFLPLLSSMTGILFWLRISKILASFLGDSKIVNSISNHTFSIMSHHIVHLFIFNVILYMIHLKYQIPYFDVEKLTNAWIYIYEVPGWNLLLQSFYVVLGIGGPILGNKIWEKVTSTLKKGRIRIKRS